MSLFQTKIKPSKYKLLQNRIELISEKYWLWAYQMLLTGVRQDQNSAEMMLLFQKLSSDGHNEPNQCLGSLETFRAENRIKTNLFDYYGSR